MNEQALRIEMGSVTHEGRVRDDNEDSLFADQESGVWAVADGMGGHENGEWASATAIDQLRSANRFGEFAERCEDVAERIHQASQIIYEESLRRGNQMGTTIVALLVQGRQFAVFWVGDSRAYLKRDGMLHQLSRDHTQVQDLIDAGTLSEQDAQGHPMSHVLSRALGVMETLELDVVADEVEPGDIFLLCSDGLHGSVDGQLIDSEMNGNHSQVIADRLLEAAIAHGAPDNVTVVAVRFAEPTLLTFGQSEATTS